MSRTSRLLVVVAAAALMLAFAVWFFSAVSASSHWNSIRPVGSTGSQYALVHG